MNDALHFDYLVIGAGTAGCVVANRLSEDPNVSVCLVEAGPRDRTLLPSLYVRVPALIVKLIANPKWNWMFNYQPDKRLGDRDIFCPRGRLVGGSSAINGMIYIRGNRHDYDTWAAAGNSGWGYDDVLPYFKRSEHWERGESSFHGRGGEWNVADQRDPNPIAYDFLRAVDELGWQRNDDFNGERQDGFGLFQVSQINGERSSSARAFLYPALRRGNVRLITNAQVTRLDIENQRATGAAVLVDGAMQRIVARREVILSAGAIGSPQLLLLSGIGPGDDLRHHGIPVKHDLPGVGANLQDHADVPVIYSDPSHVTYGLSWRALPSLTWSPISYLFSRRGPLSTNTVEAGGFIRTRPDAPAPDVELILAPALKNQPERSIPHGHGFSIHISVLHPKSRGRLALRSALPEQPPLLESNFLTDPEDLATMLRGIAMARRLVATRAMARYRGAELWPGPVRQSDDELGAWVHAHVATTYHPVGTCKMGHDAMAVVDHELRVHGIEALRVIDASIIPTTVTGNTAAPSVMIGEKGSDLVLGRTRAS